MDTFTILLLELVLGFIYFIIPEEVPKQAKEQFVVALCLAFMVYLST